MTPYGEEGKVADSETRDLGTIGHSEQVSGTGREDAGLSYLHVHFTEHSDLPSQLRLGYTGHLESLGKQHSRPGPEVSLSNRRGFGEDWVYAILFVDIFSGLATARLWSPPSPFICPPWSD